MEQQKTFESRTASCIVKALRLFFLTSLLVSASSFTADNPTTSDRQVSIAAESYTEPQPHKITKPNYPARELERGEQGWVYVQMMIDPNGKPYELEVINSTGNKEFERSTLEAIESSQFIPATLGGKPIDATIILPIVFAIEGESAARPEFKNSYTSMVKRLDANDRQGAEAALASLQPKNLYENAYLNMAKYSFAQKWGTEQEQLVAIRAAVGGMTTPKYLEKPTFLFAVRSLFLAEIKAQNYAAALSDWKTLQTLGKDDKSVKQLEPIVAKIEAIRTDPRPYTVKGRLPEGTWSYRLYRNKFFIKVLEGHVSQIKLYCEKKYVLFLFDPLLEYKVEDKFGKCSIVVIGDGGTNIELTQIT